MRHVDALRRLLSGGAAAEDLPADVPRRVAPAAGPPSEVLVGMGFAWDRPEWCVKAAARFAEAGDWGQAREALRRARQAAEAGAGVDAGFDAEFYLVALHVALGTADLEGAKRAVAALRTVGGAPHGWVRRARSLVDALDVGPALRTALLEVLPEEDVRVSRVPWLGRDAWTAGETEDAPVDVGRESREGVLAAAGSVINQEADVGVLPPAGESDSRVPERADGAGRTVRDDLSEMSLAGTVKPLPGWDEGGDDAGGEALVVPDEVFLEVVGEAVPPLPGYDDAEDLPPLPGLPEPPEDGELVPLPLIDLSSEGPGSSVGNGAPDAVDDVPAQAEEYVPLVVSAEAEAEAEAEMAPRAPRPVDVREIVNPRPKADGVGPAYGADPEASTHDLLEQFVAEKLRDLTEEEAGDLFDLGMKFLIDEDWENAYSLFYQAMQAEGCRLRAAEALLQALHGQGDLVAVRRQGALLLTFFRSGALGNGVRYWIGRAAEDQGEVVEALRQYWAVNELDPRYADVRDRMARLTAVLNEGV